MKMARSLLGFMGRNRANYERTPKLSIQGLGGIAQPSAACASQRSQAGPSAASSNTVGAGQNVPAGGNGPAASPQLQPSSAGVSLSHGTLKEVLGAQEGGAAASGAPSRQALELATAQAAQSYLPIASGAGGLNVVS